MKRRQALGHLAAWGGSALLPLSRNAQAEAPFPQRPITLVVPTAPGGSTDFSARLIAEPLNRALGQAIIVDNRPGASGNIGNQYVARAKPDGYTLLVAYSGYQVGNPHLFRQAGWDPIKDFAPVAMLTRAPQVITVSPQLPVKNLKELIAYARANPGKLNFASSGNGSIQHIAGEQFKQLTGTFITHIPYRGTGPAMQDLLAGQVDLFITTPAGVMGQVQAGKVKALAVTSQKRLTALPQVPTTAEGGLPGYELDSWFALYAPAGTPAELVQLLNTEVNRALATPELRKKAEDNGTDLALMSPRQLGDFTRAELERWGRIIATAHITLD